MMKQVVEFLYTKAQNLMTDKALPWKPGAQIAYFPTESKEPVSPPHSFWPLKTYPFWRRAVAIQQQKTFSKNRHTETSTWSH